MQAQSVGEELTIIPETPVRSMEHAARPIAARAATPLLDDTFNDPRPDGAVLGSQTTSGNIRRGADVERVLSIDNGALRIKPLLRPGWGRSGLVYGPFARQPGLAFATMVINGHGASETTTVERLRARLGRWSRGSETMPRLERFMRWLRVPQRRHWPRLLHSWYLNSQQRPQSRDLTENLAVGWFPNAVPQQPLDEGNCFIVHSSGPHNADLWARTVRGNLPAIQSLQSVPVYYVVVLREQGAAYYVASLPNAHGPAAYPSMRPVAITPANDPTEQGNGLYAGLYQSALGQIGFRAETRVTSARVAQLPRFIPWYGSAHAADSLVGAGALAGTSAEVGGSWLAQSGHFERTAGGLVSHTPASTAILDPGVASGLVHLLVDLPPDADTELRLIWRWRDPANYWAFAVSRRGVQVCIIQDDTSSAMPLSADWPLLTGCTNALQILDDGRSFSLYVNGRLAFGSPFVDDRLGEASGVGFAVAGAGADLILRSFEAHPCAVPIPAEIDCGPLWTRSGSELVAADSFGGQGDLHGRATEHGGLTWARTVGRGSFIAALGEARVQASLEQPNPERTAYTIPWADPGFADLEVSITPPGRARGGGERGRGGTIFWQDADNYITFSVYVDDWYGTSIAAFFYLNGYEELYDAVWSNVGRRIYWGQPYDFRSTFDGSHFCCYVNGEPVLSRALTDVYPEARPLAIRRVGLVANWEWGNDTGSRFRRFRALCDQGRAS